LSLASCFSLYLYPLLMISLKYLFIWEREGESTSEGRGKGIGRTILPTEHVVIKAVILSIDYGIAWKDFLNVSSGEGRGDLGAGEVGCDRKGILRTSGVVVMFNFLIWVLKTWVWSLL